MVTRIDYTRVQDLITDGAHLIEVLPSPEFIKMHLPNALNKPLKEFDRSAVDDLDPAQPVIVYCWDTQ